jgi:ABC-type lipoprotein export system ATPase subunit
MAQATQSTGRPVPNSPSLAPLLELLGVGMTYPLRGSIPAVRVLDGVNLSVRPGELIGLAGRSGSGKTTLIRIAAGLQRPTEGEVRWNGSSIASLSDDALAQRRGHQLGIVFQGGALIESLTAAENVALAGVASGVRRPDRELVMRLLHLVGLEERARNFPAQLSGGEQQRVALARGLFHDPPLLLVDEPTANLDRATGDALIGLLRQVAAAQRSLLVASHDPHLLAVADRVISTEPAV